MLHDKEGEWGDMKKIYWIMVGIIIVIYSGTVLGADNKNKLYIDVSFKENLLFDKYDVSLYIDGVEIEKLEYGDIYTYMAEVQKGMHTIKFCKENNQEISGTENITVENDCTYRCKIQTDAKQINIVNSEVIASLEGSSIVLPKLELLFLSDASERLEECGFINISYETESGKTIKKESRDWTVIKQNEQPGSVLDKNDPVILTCSKTTEFLTSYLLDKNVLEAIEEAKTIEYEISFINSITDVDMRNYLASCNTEELKKWTVEEAIPVEASQKVARLKMKYSGTRTVPDTIGMSLKYAIKELKMHGFDSVEFQSEEGKRIKGNDVISWKVIEQSPKVGAELDVEEIVSLTCKQYNNLDTVDIFELSRNMTESSSVIEESSVVESEQETISETEKPLESELSTEAERETEEKMTTAASSENETTVTTGEHTETESSTEVAAEITTEVATEITTEVDPGLDILNKLESANED